jgi:hypothetical protein
MLRRHLNTAVAVGARFGASSSAAMPVARHYRLLPHLDNEIEELAETQKAGRWFMGRKMNYALPPKQGEIMCEKMNMRERRRNGTLPEKSIARGMTQFWAKDGKLQRPDPNYEVKWITITIIGFDGHPYKFRTTPMPEVTLNTLIDGSGMCHGWGNMWSQCRNTDCGDFLHGDGCIVNVDIDTLDKLPVPGRWEYSSLVHYRTMNRADIKYNTRFSCQLKLTEELDGGLFALKQFYSRSLREAASDWGEDDNYATLACHKCRKIEPWAPMLEEPTLRDFNIQPEMLWSMDYETVLKHKYPYYKRKDGFHTKPEYWAAYV